MESKSTASRKLLRGRTAGPIANQISLRVSDDLALSEYHVVQLNRNILLHVDLLKQNESDSPGMEWKCIVYLMNSRSFHGS